MTKQPPSHQLAVCLYNAITTGLFERRLKAALTAASLSLLVMGGNALAATEDAELETLNQLVTANRYQEAYALADQLMEEHEGEPEFDFLYGLAALETGRPNEAVFAFERITYDYPDQQRVKLELARAFYQINNFPASRQLFQEVLDTNPGETVAANVQIFLDLIEERENTIAGSFRWYLNSSIGSDSNVNSATELGVISTPIGDVELSANGQSIEDTFNDIGGGMVYNKPFTKSSGLSISGNYSHHNNFDSDDFDLDVLASDATYAKTLGTSRVSVGLRGQLVDLSSERFQTSVSLLSTLQHAAGDGWTQGLTGAYTRVRYDDSANANASLRDVNQMLVSGMLGKAMGSFNHSVSVYYGDENAVVDAGKNNAQQFYGVAFAEQYQLNSKNLPYFRISLHRSDNKKSDPIFNLEREDDTFSTSLGWIWLANRNINVTTDVTYTDNDSNIDLYKYDRVKYQTGLRYQF
ncbi:MAG: porin family protein [Pseudomonadota bacterium]